MTTPSVALMNILTAQKHPSLTVSMALCSLEEACQEIADLDSAYGSRRRELVLDRNELIKDAAESRVAIRHLQTISGLSRTSIWNVRAGGTDA